MTHRPVGSPLPADADAVARARRRRSFATRVVAFVAAAATALALLAAPASAAGRTGGDNTAVAVNTKDGSSLFKFAFAIRTVADGVVDQTNAAVAYASCTECQTVAVAIEIVFVTNAASIQTPTNIALAINNQCTGCQTLATAYQFVVPTGGPVHFTADGRRGITDIVRQIRDLGRSELDIVAIQDQVDGLMKQLQEILATQLVRGPPESDEQLDGEATSTTAPTSTSTSTATSTTSDSTTTAVTNAATTTTTDATSTTSSPPSSSTSTP